MIDIELLRSDPERVKRGVAAKRADPKLVDDFLSVDADWKKTVFALDELRAKQKKLGEERKIEEAKAAKEEIKKLEEKVTLLEVERNKTLRLIPNPPLARVITGKDESQNKTLREVGKKSSDAAKDYLSIVEPLGLIDMERGGKVSGSRFGYILGPLARLEFAIVQLVMNTLTDEKLLKKLIKKHGLSVSPNAFLPIVPPVLIKKEMMEGMGYVERGAEEIYYIEKDGLYLIATSEQAIGPMHANEILDEDTLPRRYLGFSTSFRREAGSHGKDTKGILRVHQFDKLEMFSITKPEWSEEEHKLLLAIEEYLMQELAIPYRVLDICSGDLGDPAAAKYDIEAWLPGQNDGKGEYRETHSTSNTTDFQARRLNVRYRSKTSGKVEFVHMLNGTAFAIGRALIAIIENYQNKDGSVTVPKALQKYAGFKKIG